MPAPGGVTVASSTILSPTGTQGVTGRRILQRMFLLHIGRYAGAEWRLLIRPSVAYIVGPGRDTIRLVRRS
jgi:hypothetical protein